MKPASFRYVAADDVHHAVSLLSAHGDAAKLLAGGQSLVPMMNLRLSRPDILIDLNRIEGADRITVEDGTLRVGMLARQRSAERAEIVRTKLPLLAEAISHIGHMQIRSRGTLVGSCCHADPSAEIPCVLLTVDGSIRVQGPDGSRDIPAADFFLGFFQTALSPGEIATELLFPLPGEGTGWSFLEFARRHGDFAMVAVATLLKLSARGEVEHAAVSLSGVGPAPIRARMAEVHLLGKRPDAELFAQAAAEAAQEIDPADDVQASGNYRRQLARTLVARGLQEAFTRAARGGA
jgi:CO/xanthine dehydrogenase FAD-binding subunit